MYVNVYIDVKSPPLYFPPEGESRATPPPVRLWTFFSPFYIHYSPFFLAPAGGKMSVGQKGGFFLYFAVSCRI